MFQVPSKHLDISVPSNPKFDDQPEVVISLDDATVRNHKPDGSFFFNKRFNYRWMKIQKT